jgi:hypothetical protein
MREHWNNVPGDLADEDVVDVPGGMGTYNPDQDPDAMVSETTGTSVITPDGRAVERTNTGESTAGSGIAHAKSDGSTYEPNELAEGQEDVHPGAGIGVTGADRHVA